MVMAGAMIPMLVLIACAVDITRAYSAKTRMQSACDAGSLAARRVMRNENFNSEVTDTGTRFFNFNFPQGSYGTSTFTPTITRPSSGVIRMSARTQMPTTLMGVFGYTTLPLSVECDASLNFVNTDVVLVLDVTGSMADPIDGTAKIDALEDAVLALYDELAPIQTQLTAQGLRLRYGIVPYSSTVNVGHLLVARDASYVTDSTTYPSRVANYATEGGSFAPNTPTSSSGWQTNSSSITSTACQTWVQSAAVNGGGPAPTATTRTSYRGSSSSATYVASTNWGWSGASDTSGTSRSCRRWRTIETTTYSWTGRVFTNWIYRQEAYDTSAFKTGSSITLATNANGFVAAPGGTYNAQQLATAATGVGTTSVSWNGCIEERDTTTSINGGTSLTIPADAHDLNINLIPNSNATRWHPMMPDVVYTRTAGSTSTTNTTINTTTGWIKNNDYSTGYWACPAEARRLDVMTRTQMENYLDDLEPIGGTYHDIGMIWGARFISTGGVFADGCTEYNGMPCNRHIIFLTDGQQTTYCNVLTAYGVEQNDMRTTGAGDCPSQQARHEQRFRMICNAAKNMNTSIWVIAFDTGLNANLTGCASNANQASTSSSQTALIAKFREIGNQIGALRLVK
ncbi:pilus assembly protein TadG-related protein [Novosphingobium sp.]|uniref:pilus assembly protein TadG-related protein n=2 Tax=unclassified Novosphingobium TaxID=2644732 RepID=UPI0025CDB94D|nr:MULTISPECIES: pilus assembly protein TadG-related protein [unclassified Novosphingobium]HQS69895.1 pilus assembly protein TadG-related protein [Novosphingobium sp.]